MNPTRATVSLMLCAVLRLVCPAQGEVSVPEIFSDNMMLQRADGVPVFGTAEAGEAVAVRLLPGEGPPAASAQTKAGADGKWMARLDLARVPNQSYALEISGSNALHIRNVLVGQVWLASGQSNMEWRVANVNDARAEIAAANYPEIRHFLVAKQVAPVPTDALRGRWEVATPATVAQFTAVGYFFARDLHQALGVPVGIIHSSWGGTPGEAWTSAAALEPLGDFARQIEAVRAGADPAATAAYTRRLEEWSAAMPPGTTTTEAELIYTQANYDDSAWQSVTFPGTIESAGINVDGVIWVRRQVELKKGGDPAVLTLGAIDDFDTTYVNGVEVGSTPLGAAEAYSKWRRYAIPAGILRAGTNTIAVRVLDVRGDAGLTGPAERMALDVGKERHALSGQWKVRPEPTIDVGPILAHLSRRPAKPGGNQGSPTTLFNGMIHPLIPYGIAGAIWYQGEANVGRQAQYVKLLSAMIRDWRAQWNQPDGGVLGSEAGKDFPFYIVQLANFRAYSADANANVAWAQLREAQREVADTVEHAGLAVTIDIGDERDIHPRNKQDVGKRLALVALARTYGKDVEYSGPRLEGAKLEEGRLVLTFAHAIGGLVVRPIEVPQTTAPTTRAALAGADTQVKGFTVRDAQGKWHFAKAQIVDGTTISVSAPGVDRPTAVRYAFADNPVANLYNGAGLPAVPFERSLEAK